MRLEPDTAQVSCAFFQRLINGCFNFRKGVSTTLNRKNANTRLTNKQISQSLCAHMRIHTGQTALLLPGPALLRLCLSLRVSEIPSHSKAEYCKTFRIQHGQRHKNARNRLRYVLYRTTCSCTVKQRNVFLCCCIASQM